MRDMAMRACFPGPGCRSGNFKKKWRIKKINGIRCKKPAGWTVRCDFKQGQKNPPAAARFFGIRMVVTSNLNLVRRAPACVCQICDRWPQK